MNLKICTKQLGSRRMQRVDYALEESPDTLRALLTSIVRQEVRRYNDRLRDSDNARPLDQDILAGMLATGKVSFGAVHSDRRASADKACDTAIQAFEDGLVRVFLNESELTDLNAPLRLQECDCLTFLKLSMLAGSML